MKKWWIICTTVLLLIAVTGCSVKETASSETNGSESTMSSGSNEGSMEAANSVTYELEKMPKYPNINAAPVNDLTNLYALTETYVWPLTVNGGVWFQSWENPAQIPADQLIYICSFNEWVEYDTSNETVQPFAPANEVEAALQKHFDVTTEYLRSSTAYNAENNTYPMIEGGGAWAAVAMSAKQEGNQVIIQVGQLPPDETKASEIGTLTLELTDENIVRYLSYQIVDETM